jgi:lipid-A-disaccharide synthase
LQLIFIDMPKIYMIAGEASGDLHGANLIKALRQINERCEIRCWGGDQMQAAGAEVVKHYRDLAFMGFVEVIANIGTIMRNFAFCRADIESFQPDVLILIDYPGFNLRMAKWAHEKGIRVFYYISPQIWAWKQSRVHDIKRTVDEMYCVLPFEKAFYERFNYPVHFVGHPLLDAVADLQSESEEAWRARNKLGNKPIIALLPGSRKQEISTMLPVMLAACKRFANNYSVIVAGAPGQEAQFYASFIQENDAELLFGETYSILRFARAGMVTSGTATLEAALFKMPQVVCYKGSSISYAIAKRLVKVKYISLVNLILDRPAVREMIQGDMNENSVSAELDALLHDSQKRKEIEDAYEALRDALGGQGASKRTAMLMLKSLNT